MNDRLELLYERLSANFNDFKALTLEESKQQIFDDACEITAISDAYYYLTEVHDFETDEIEFLLKFKEPLIIVADEWLQRQSDMSDFSFALDKVLGDKDLINKCELV